MVRFLDPREFDQAARLLVDAYPHRGHEPRSWLRPAPSEQARRWGAFGLTADRAAQAAAPLMGYGALWVVEPRKLRFDVVVSPPNAHAGIGRVLFETVLADATSAGAATLQARALATDEEALGFLARRQFVETMRMRGFVLNLSTIDTPGIAAKAVAPPRVSIRDVTSADRANDRFWRRLAELHEAAREGWPDPDPGGIHTPIEPDALRSMLMPSAGIPVAFAVASCDGRFVGYSLLTRRPTPGEVQFGATAVRPGYRRQGIAMALRIRCLDAARRAGYVIARSASGSDGLIRINAKLGFRETYCEVRLLRDLSATRAPV
jgi:mycothiol synthase